MGLAVLVLGYSGSGKSASMRNFGENELALINVNSKALPFRTKFYSVLNSDKYTDIGTFIKQQTTKTIVVDDSQYLMANEFMRRAKETGYQKFTDMGKNFWELVKLTETLTDDKIVYFFNHIDTAEDGRQKAKTIGKLLDEKINIEGMFTTVLKTVVSDGKYLFATQTDGNDTCKSPMGLFETKYIPNDLKFVDEALRIYYNLAPEHKCNECGEIIKTFKNKTVQQIVEGTIENYGRKLCMKCVDAERNKQNAALPAST